MEIAAPTVVVLPDHLGAAVGQQNPVLPRHHAGAIAALLLTIVESGRRVHHLVGIAVGLRGAAHYGDWSCCQP